MTAESQGFSIVFPSPKVREGISGLEEVFGRSKSFVDLDAWRYGCWWYLLFLLMFWKWTSVCCFRIYHMTYLSSSISIYIYVYIYIYVHIGYSLPNMNVLYVCSSPVSSLYSSGRAWPLYSDASDTMGRAQPTRWMSPAMGWDDPRSFTFFHVQWLL